LVEARLVCDPIIGWLRYSCLVQWFLPVGWDCWQAACKVDMLIKAGPHGQAAVCGSLVSHAKCFAVSGM